MAHYSIFVGLRYSFAKERNRFTSMISLVSMLGMVLGVASLIAVLSVMNGFGAELRSRILSLVPHGYLEADAEGLTNWEALLDELALQPGVVGSAPFISEKVILSSGVTMRGAQLSAVDPAREGQVSRKTE